VFVDHAKVKKDNKTSIHAIHNLKESVLFKKKEKRKKKNEKSCEIKNQCFNRLRI
jgi:hypothetical protein